MKYLNIINRSNKKLINISKRILKQERIPFPSKYEFIQTGHVNNILILDNNLILRFSNDSTSITRLDLESKIINSLKNKIPVPNIISVGNIGNVGYQILSHIKGQTLSKVWDDVTLANKNKIVIQIVEMLRVLHQIKAGDFKFICLPTNKTNTLQEFNDCEWRDVHLYLNKIKLDRDLIDESSKYYEKSRQCLDEENSAHLIHGDLHFDNILVHENSVSAVIDFEFSMFGSRDRELYKIEEFVRNPGEYGFKNNTYINFMILFKKYYPEIFKTKNLSQKLDLYDFIYTWKAFIYNDKFKNISKLENLNTVEKIRNIIEGKITRIL